jgi:hypothetical protein
MVWNEDFLGFRHKPLHVRINLCSMDCTTYFGVSSLNSQKERSIISGSVHIPLVQFEPGGTVKARKAMLPEAMARR